jgi:hypothetical protein
MTSEFGFFFCRDTFGSDEDDALDAQQCSVPMVVV